MSYRQFLLRVFTVVGIVIAAIGMWELRSILLMGFLSAIIALSLSIPVSRLQQMGVPRNYSIAITVVGVVIALIFLGTWLLPVTVNQMADLVNDLPDAVQGAGDTYNDWRTKQTQVVRDNLPEFDFDELEESFSREDEEGNRESLVNITEVTNFAIPIVTGVGSSVLALLANLLIIAIISLYLLVDPMDYAYGGLMLVPRDYQARFLEIMGELRRALVSWMLALTLSISVTVVLVVVGLGMILQIPNSLAIGVIAGFSTIIPNVGVYIPMVPIAIFTLSSDTPERIAIVIPMYFVIQQIEGTLITPRFVKQTMNIPAGATMFFQLIAASLFGLLGILLAVPMLAVLITLVREIYVFDILGLKGANIRIEQDTDGKLVIAKPSDSPSPPLPEST